jgi:tRNA pseudouridine38-40 synthase
MTRSKSCWPESAATAFERRHMKNFKLTIEYDGTRYCGWQRQADSPTIQAEIERAIGIMTRCPVTLHGAGRTDAGVHAFGQAASFHAETRLNPDEMRKGLNSLLPPDIAVADCRQVPDDFHARYWAKSKVYHYRILNRECRPAVGRNYAWFIHRPLDWAGMRRAAALLIGCRDFKAFESAGSPRAHTTRTVIAAQWQDEPEGRAVFQIEADGFLRGMVRNIVGTLVGVGLGRLDGGRIPDILASRDRRQAGAAAPPQGLFLMEVRY